MFVLNHPPIILVKLDDNNQDIGLGPGIVAVEKQLCEPFYAELEVTDERCSRARLLKVRARREQIPLTIATASTLYTLQGTTAEPGLVYYFKTPRRLSKVMKWIATCPKCERDVYYARKSKRELACGKCCKEHNNNRYTPEYKFTWSLNRKVVKYV